MQETRINEIREDCEQDVNNPGKFEMQERYMPYIHKQIGMGCGECLASRQHSVDCVHKVDITDEDVEIFPELDGVDAVFLHEDNYGFVTELTEDQAQELAQAINESERG